MEIKKLENILLTFYNIEKKLSSLGNKILDYTDKRINTIDNLSEIAIELSALKNSRNLFIIKHDLWKF